MRTSLPYRELRSRLLGVARTAGVDKPVAFAVLGNIITLFIGPITALLIASRFSPELQGYYYTFGSLLALQAFFDMGLGQALVQFASHEWSSLSFAGNGNIVGNVDSLSRLRSLARLSMRWYGLGALLILFVMAPLGYIFFARAPDSDIAWAWPWIAMCFILSLNFAVMPIFYLLQGCNRVSQFWFYRLIEKSISGLSLWVAILLGAGLWSGVLAGACSLAWSILFIGTTQSKLITSLGSPPGASRVSWRTELWPVQWRVAVSWSSAYFSTSMFAPILFRLSGPVAAGQMGMTISLSNVLHALSVNWVITKGPHFGVLVARENYKELDRVFFHSLLRVVVVACLGASGIWLFILLLNLFHLPLATRILPLIPTSFLLLATVLNAFCTSLAIYLRAHKKEPLVTVYLLAVVLVLLAALVLGREWGAAGVALSYLLVMMFVQLPGSLITFKQCRYAWHR